VTLYAAYGSNLDPLQMLLRAPHSPGRGTGWLLGWRLTFGGEDLGWEGALATVVEDEDPTNQVFVGLYDTKIRVRVATLEGDVTAWLYVLDDYEGGLPSARYLGIVADAAEAAGAPDDYVASLRVRPCRSIG
jgi:hypothetical protein